MDQHEKLHLQKLIAANDSVDTTEEIRKLKHSIKIKDDVERLYQLKIQYYMVMYATNFDSFVIKFDVLENKIVWEFLIPNVTMARKIQRGETPLDTANA